MLSHKGVKWITVGWTAFITENVILSHNRQYIIETFGEKQYHTAYSLLSSAACLSIAYGYCRYGRNMGPLINEKYWKPQSFTFRFSAFSLQSIGLVGFSQNFPKLQMPISIFAQQQSVETDPLMTTAKSDKSQNQKIQFAAQCPIDWTPNDVPSDSVYGLKRITRHPMLFSLGMFGCGIALKTTFATRAILFGFPMIFALIGGAHQDYRHRRNDGGYLSAEMEEQTCLIPFVALLRGKQSWNDLWNEMKHVNMTIAMLTAIYLNASVAL